jgi:CHAT domain-containing protein/Tfp pilus assembly protein PilF
LSWSALLLAVLPAVLAPCPGGGRSAAVEPATGVIVEWVAKGSLAEKAGLRPGDVILSWCWAKPREDPPCSVLQPVQSPFDFAELALEQAPRGGVRLQGRRGTAEAVWSLYPGSLEVEARPVLSAELLGLHRQGQELAAAGRPDAAAERWRAAAARAGDERLAAWSLARAAQVLAGGEGWRQSDALYAEAIDRAERAVGRQAAALLLFDRARRNLELDDLARAEESFRRAESILAEVKPESLERAAAQNGLATIAMRFGELEVAEGFLRRALALREKLDPRGLSVPQCLHNLGILMLARGDLPAAEQYFQQALALFTERAPESPLVANTLSELAKPARDLGDLATAERYYRRALAIRRKANPESLPVASSLLNLGILAERQGRFRQVESEYRRALAMTQRLDPEGPLSAQVLLSLGEAVGRRGRWRQAADLFCRTVDLAERRWARPGGTALARLALATTNRVFYNNCLAARAEAGQRSAAFRILERGRARAFLEQLAERELVFSAELRPEILRQRQALDAEYDRVQGQIGRRSTDLAETESQSLRARLRELYARQQELIAKIRATSPRFAALRYPQPVDLAGARRALDPGTVLLAYSVGDTKTYLFVVRPIGRRGRGLAVFTLPVGEQALRASVRNFWLLLQNESSDRRVLAAQSEKLYDLLLRPAERQLAGARRLLVSPDGPLHTLPFAALSRRGVFLAEWKPIHSVLSATIYAEIRASRRTAALSAESGLVAFGAPSYPQLGREIDAEVESAVRRGLSLEPLPASRQEVEAIKSLFPKALTFLGAEATEEKAKATAPQARLLHFACHGFLDERIPLNSGLALSIPEHPAPGQDNGLLQAWEIFEQMRLDADLVTLSACDSGRGQEMGGEGLIGLTRAFQYAGARSVLASLWSVADDSTADLMRRFYTYLKQGKSKDEALRLAQVDLIRGPEATSHPYHWAAFQLSGDWR